MDDSEKMKRKKKKRKKENSRLGPKEIYDKLLGEMR